MVSLLKKRNSRSVGSQFELMAEKYLQQQGLRKLAGNYSGTTGEIDLIMLDNDDLVFVEVRYRKATHYGTAIDTINPAKQHKIIRTAQLYLARNKQYAHSACRFDVVAIDKLHNGELALNWIKNAFME